MKENSNLKIMTNGIVTENPTFIQLLGMCPTLAVTTSLVNAIGMGLSATFVLIFSNLVISLLRKFIPNKIRIASYIVVIAAFVSVIEMLLKAYLPAISDALGLFIPLITVNCIILARAESFASKNSPIPSAFDGLGMGLGFTLGLSVLGSVREILGAGTILGFPLFGANFEPALIFILPPGAFLALGIILAIYNIIRSKKKGAAK
ncbi:MAG: electron transport complex subunit E [Ruminococcaceae bacterium]|nr:electron transport complex subunit E [Oscillospiraceae bacterium]